MGGCRKGEEFKEMSLTSFKERTEITGTRFADTPLGKMTEGKLFDKPLSEYDKPLGIICEAYKNCPKDGSNGHWENGVPGDGDWYPDRDYTPPPKSKKEPPYNNPNNLTFGEILDKYGIDHISFKNGEPDFSEVCKGTVKIQPFTDSRDDNFDKADIELAKQKGCSPEEVRKWRKENNYTWHECQDMKTMQKVPNEIHANIPHSGGISEAKKGTGE
jgi:hypothetical protein